MRLFLYAWWLAFACLAYGQAQSSTSSSPAASATPCSSLELIVARGTNENGNLGLGVGDPLLNATKALIPGATGYRVDYPALLTLASVNDGIKDVVAHFESQSNKCPDQKYVLVGYSQGGFVILGAAGQLNPKDYPRIVAVTQFGDPGNRDATDPDKGFPPALGKRLKENCVVGDPVCTNNGTDFNKHVLYNVPALGFISNSASYIKEQYDTDGHAGPSPAVPGPGAKTPGNRNFWCGLSSVLGLDDTADCQQQASSGLTPSMTMTSGSNLTGPTATGSIHLSTGLSSGLTGNSTGYSGTGTGTVSRSSVAPTSTSTLSASNAGYSAAIPGFFLLLAQILAW